MGVVLQVTARMSLPMNPQVSLQEALNLALHITKQVAVAIALQVLSDIPSPTTP
jgi:hypothetical protein